MISYKSFKPFVLSLINFLILKKINAADAPELTRFDNDFFEDLADKSLQFCRILLFINSSDFNIGGDIELNPYWLNNFLTSVLHEVLICFMVLRIRDQQMRNTVNDKSLCSLWQK